MNYDTEVQSFLKVFSVDIHVDMIEAGLSVPKFKYISVNSIPSLQQYWEP